MWRYFANFFVVRLSASFLIQPIYHLDTGLPGVVGMRCTNLGNTEPEWGGDICTISQLLCWCFSATSKQICSTIMPTCFLTSTAIDVMKHVLFTAFHVRASIKREDFDALSNVAHQNGILPTLFDYISQSYSHPVSDWFLDSFLLLIIAYRECLFVRFFNNSHSEASRSHSNGGLHDVSQWLLQFSISKLA